MFGDHKTWVFATIIATSHFLHLFCLVLIPSRRFKCISGWQKLPLYFKEAITKFKTNLYFQLTTKFGFANKISCLIKYVKKKESSLSLDEPCDSPGHNSKYLTYSVLGQKLKKK